MSLLPRATLHSDSEQYTIKEIEKGILTFEPFGCFSTRFQRSTKRATNDFFLSRGNKKCRLLELNFKSPEKVPNCSHKKLQAKTSSIRDKAKNLNFYSTFKKSFLALLGTLSLITPKIYCIKKGKSSWKNML
jgi:hypothetical protein